LKAGFMSGPSSDSIAWLACSLVLELDVTFDELVVLHGLIFLFMEVVCLRNVCVKYSFFLPKENYALSP
jgi:hypothetical protein